MDLVHEFELVTLELVTGKDLHNVVLTHELNDFGYHLSVALNIVGAVKGASFVHRAETFDQVLVRVEHRGDIVCERRAIFPPGDLEDLEDVCDVILLFEHLLLLILLILVQADNFTHCSCRFNELLSESLLSEVRESALSR